MVISRAAERLSENESFRRVLRDGLAIRYLVSTSGLTPVEYFSAHLLGFTAEGRLFQVEAGMNLGDVGIHPSARVQLALSEKAESYTELQKTLTSWWNRDASWWKEFVCKRPFVGMSLYGADKLQVFKVSENNQNLAYFHAALNVQLDSFSRSLQDMVAKDTGIRPRAEAASLLARRFGTFAGRIRQEQLAQTMGTPLKG